MRLTCTLHGLTVLYHSTPCPFSSPHSSDNVSPLSFQCLCSIFFLFPDDFILGPLNNGTSGNDSTQNNTNNNDKHKQNIPDPAGKSSDFSEEGYSASEEDVFDDHTRPPARRKSRGERSMNSFKRQLSMNGYVALEDRDGKPTSYL